MPLLIAVPFRALKIQNQNKCPSKNEQRKFGDIIEE